MLVLGWLAALIFKPFFAWIVLGLLFGYLFYRPFQALERHMRRGFAATIVLFLVLIVFFLPFVLLVVLLFHDLRSLSAALQQTDYEGLIRNILQSTTDALSLPFDETQVSLGATAVANNMRDSLRAIVAS